MGTGVAKPVKLNASDSHLTVAHHEYQAGNLNAMTKANWAVKFVIGKLSTDQAMQLA